MSKKNRNTNKALKALKRRSSYRRGGRTTAKDFGRSYRERQLNPKKEDKTGSGPVKTVGRKEGIAKGKKEEKEEIAKKMLSKNHPISDIADLTGLSISEIEKL